MTSHETATRLGDHKRGCEGRNYTCTCGYDDARDEEIEKLKAERDEARAKLFPYADATEIAGVSWDGKYLIGDKNSIRYFHEMKNRGEQIDVYKRAYDERLAAAEAERDAKAAMLEEARRVAALADGRLSLLLKAYPDDSDTYDHPVATRYVLKQVQSFLARLEQSDAAK